MNKKIGIMGGTFNPIHIGHMKMAQYAYEECELDEILFLPAGRPEYKADIKIASGADRMEMVKLAIEGIHYFSVSDMELTRQGNTYTYDTMNILKDHNPEVEYFFIIGADSLYQLHEWHRARELMKIVPFLVATRDGNSLEALEQRANQLKMEYGARIRLLHMPNTDVASSGIRDMVIKQQSIEGLVPEKVAKYIEQHGLYR